LFDIFTFFYLFYFYNIFISFFSAANKSPLSREAFTMHITEAALNWTADNWLLPPKKGFEKWK
jgi:hypothetical protein